MVPTKRLAITGAVLMAAIALVGAPKPATASCGTMDCYPDAVFSANNPTVSEAAGEAVFTVRLSSAFSGWSTVDYAMAAGHDSDYVAVTGTLTFSPGETARTVTVPLVNDNAPEYAEQYKLTLSKPWPAEPKPGDEDYWSRRFVAVSNEGGRLTINDDDPDPNLWVNDIFVNESDGWVNFTLSLSYPTDKTVYVDVATADGTANRDDYDEVRNSVRFEPGETQKTVSVWIRDDLRPEPSETFFLNLSVGMVMPGGPGAVITDAQGVVTIYDDDTSGPPPTVQPTMSVSDASVLEGSRKGHKVKLVFTVTLSQPSSSVVLAGFATANQSAMAGSDYLFKHGNVIFQPGQTVKLVTVKVRSDKLREADETLLLNIFNPTNATIGDGQGVGTILNDD